MELKLPNILASRQNLIAVHRELAIFLDTVTQSILRHDKELKYPAVSASLRALASDNQVNLRDEAACRKLLSSLEKLKQTTPLIHISFAADPPADVLQRLVSWFRKEVDPHIVIQVGLQPTIAAGIVLRTPNKQFDFSLRQHLYSNRAKLKEALGYGQ